MLLDLVDQYYISGAVAAFAHELMYWTNVIRRRHQIRVSLLFLSLLYVIVGAVLAGLACQEPELRYIPYALGIGYLWNDFLKGLSGVVVTISKTRELLEEKLAKGTDG